MKKMLFLTWLLVLVYVEAYAQKDKLMNERVIQKIREKYQKCETYSEKGTYHFIAFSTETSAKIESNHEYELYLDNPKKNVKVHSCFIRLNSKDSTKKDRFHCRDLLILLGKSVDKNKAVFGDMKNKSASLSFFDFLKDTTDKQPALDGAFSIEKVEFGKEACYKIHCRKAHNVTVKHISDSMARIREYDFIKAFDSLTTPVNKDMLETVRVELRKRTEAENQKMKEKNYKLAGIRVCTYWFRASDYLLLKAVDKVQFDDSVSIRTFLVSPSMNEPLPEGVFDK